MHSLACRARYVFLSIGLMSLNHQAYAANDHIALVIGNSHYSYTSSLPNTLHDAEDVATALGNAGFDVTLKRDTTRDELQAALDQLSAKAPTSQEIIFYYSGHAFQSEGKNYLAPVDIHVTRRNGIDQEAVSLDTVLQALAGSHGPTILLLDACRTNPFTGSGLQGLSRPLVSASDVLISFSTAPNNVADDGEGTHSPFTRALLRLIVEPGVAVEDALREVRRIVETSTEGRQVPWDESSLRTRAFFRPPLIITAQIRAADDDAMVIVNGEDLTSWGSDGNSVKKIPIHAGRNPFVIRVFNQRSYTGGPPLLGGHLPEGWNYQVLLATDEGNSLGSFSDSEDRPADNGPRHGKWFTVVRGEIEVDETNQVRLVDVDSKAWLH
jgi:Caspase domain